MNQKELVEICRSRGHDFSIPLIYRYGKKYGFLVQYTDVGRDRYKVDEKKFFEWLDNWSVDTEKYVALKDICKEYGITFAALKYTLIKNNCEVKKRGSEQNGLYYAKREDIERVIGQYNRRTEK